MMQDIILLQKHTNKTLKKELQRRKLQVFKQRAYKKPSNYETSKLCSIKAKICLFKQSTNPIKNQNTLRKYSSALVPNL